MRFGLKSMNCVAFPVPTLRLSRFAANHSERQFYSLLASVKSALMFELNRNTLVSSANIRSKAFVALGMSLM